MKNYKLILSAIVLAIASSSLLEAASSWKCFFWPFTEECKREKLAEKQGEVKGAQKVAEKSGTVIEKVTIEVSKPKPAAVEKSWRNLWGLLDWKPDTEPSKPVVITK